MNQRLAAMLCAWLIVAPACSFRCGCGAPDRRSVHLQLTHETDSESLVEALRSVHPDIASTASRLLFEKGLEALPQIAASISDDRKYLGICGSSALDSSYIIVPDDEPPTRGEQAPPTTVGEHCVYLVEAIALEHYYFRDHCYRGLSRDTLLAIQCGLLTLLQTAGPGGITRLELLNFLGGYTSQLAD